jgi:hypothetical protein
MRKKQIAKLIEAEVVNEWTTFVDDAEYKYRWNDEVVSLEEYKKLKQDHENWVVEVEKSKEEPKKRKGKKRE